MSRDVASQELLDRLLSDPVFRAAFRADPARALREAGLAELADDVGPVGPRKALETLEIRESRSSLAGAMMAVMLEGVALAAPDDALAAHVSAPAPAAARPEPAAAAAIDAPPAAAAAAPSGSAAGSLSPDDIVDIAERRGAPQPVVESDGPDGGDADHGDGNGEDPSGDENEPDENEPDEAESDENESGGDDDGGSDDDSDAPGEGSNGEDANDSSSDGDSSDDSDDGSDSSDGSDSGDDSDDSDDSDSGDDSDDSDSSDGGDSPDSGDAPPLEPGAYPGDSAPQAELARWMGAAAQKRGLPAELPVMAALTESGLQNLPGGDRDSVGFFQMRLGTWNKDEYAGYPAQPEKQLDWFLDKALEVRAQRIARGQAVDDPKQYGDWIADIERPAEQYRGRYQFNFEKAHALIEVAQAKPRGGAGAELIDVTADGLHAGPRALAAVADAQRYMGVPYKWGGSSPSGFDCSGLVQYVYAKVGIKLPRVTDQQILAPGGRQVDRDSLLPGDLVFFRDSSGYVHHVGISLGGDKFVNAPHTGADVRIDSLDEPYFAKEFAGGRRFDGAVAVEADARAAVSSAAPPVDDRAVRIAMAAVQHDAGEAARPGTLIFKALERQERGKGGQVVQFLPAVPRTA